MVGRRRRQVSETKAKRNKEISQKQYIESASLGEAVCFYDADEREDVAEMLLLLLLLVCGVAGGAAFVRLLLLSLH